MSNSEGGVKMLTKIRHAQSTLEYAFLVSVVVGGLLTMQNYLKRSIHGKIAEVADSISSNPYSPGITEKKEYSSSHIDKIVETTVAGAGGKTITEITGATQDVSIDTAIKGLDSERWLTQHE